MDVFVADEQSLPVDTERVAALARHVMTAENVEEEAELSVLFVTEDHMQRLNARFAGDDYATDVLSFPLSEDDEDEDDEEDVLLLGDVVICPSVASNNAQRIGHPLEQEIDTLVVHGTLHLLGYDHQGDDDRSKMEERQRALLASYGGAA